VGTNALTLLATTILVGLICLPGHDDRAGAALTER